MGSLRTLAGTAVFLLAAACGDSEPDRVVVVTANGSEGSGTSGGGTIVVTNQSLSARPLAWVFGPAVPVEGRVPPTSLLAVGDALFHIAPDAELVDAVRTGEGTVALVRTPEGRLLLVLYGEGEPVSAPAPEGARRVLSGTGDTFSVRILVADDLAIRAALAGGP
jgi:hypothetical protein